MPKRLIKHNPAFLSPEELRRSFVVRGAELQLILQILRENTGEVNQHVLLVASRGMGKTMLARRAAIALEDDADLQKRWLPVVVAEDKYNVATAGELWVETLGQVARCRVKTPERWAAAYERLRRELDETRRREGALARLRELAADEQRRLLIVFENLNMIFNEQASNDAGWDLRGTLLTEPNLMLLATATCRFDEIENADKSMYDLFRELKLQPLQIEECRALWSEVAGTRLDDDQLRPLQILTGGNPRLLAILASFAAGQSFRDILDELTGLIDDNTTYFKANVEALPPLERRVFATLAEIWEPAGARDVARLARLAVNTTSSLLKRLMTRGAVETVSRKGRKSYYQVAERLYNIYHLMRQSHTGTERARAVVEFMVRFYGIEGVARGISADARSLLPEERTGHVAAYGYLLSRYASDRTARERLLSATADPFRALPEVAIVLSHMACMAETRDGAGVNEAEDLATRAHYLFERRDYPGALALLDEVVARFGERPEVELAEPVARALVNKGVTLGSLGRSEEEIAVYDEVIARFGERPEVELAEQVASALFNKGVTLRSLGRSEEALTVCDEVVARFGERPEVSLSGAVAQAQVFRSLTLAMSSRWEEVWPGLIDSLRNQAVVRKAMDAVIRLAMWAAKGGREREILTILEQSASAKWLEPLIVALRMRLGMEYRAPREVVEVARDVLRKMEPEANGNQPENSGATDLGS